MSVQNEHLKNRFTERYNDAANGINFFKACIDMLEGIKEEQGVKEVVENFVEGLSGYNACLEDMNLAKQIFAEFISGQMSKTETVAYFNYLHDTAYSKAHNMLVIQDIFKCYF